MIKAIKNTAFLVLFFLVGLLFTYFNYKGDKEIAFYCKPFITLALVVSYLLHSGTVKQKMIFVGILIAAFTGDVLFNFETQITHILGMGSFLVFLLLLMVLISREAKEIILSTLLRYSLPFLVVFFLILYFFFDYENTLSSIYIITGAMVSMLCSFSFYYYLKDRNLKSLYYFLGSLCFILTGFTKMYNKFYGYYDVTRVLNNLSYIFSLYFFYSATITQKTKKELIDKKL